MYNSEYGKLSFFSQYENKLTKLLKKEAKERPSHEKISTQCLLILYFCHSTLRAGNSSCKHIFNTKLSDKADFK